MEESAFLHFTSSHTSTHCYTESNDLIKEVSEEPLYKTKKVHKPVLLVGVPKPEAKSKV